MEQLWFNSYSANMPHTINSDAYSSLLEMFDESCKSFAVKPALISFDSVMTYDSLAKKSRAFATFLQRKLKLQKGDRIALMLPNVLQYPVAFFGALRAGLIVVNVNPLYTARELIYQINDAGAETIVVLANFAHVLQHALPETRIKNVIITEVGDLCGFVKSHIINFLARRKFPEWYIPEAITFKQTLSYGRGKKFTEVTINGDDIALLQYTGGTTGVSKGAILTHRNLIANVEQAFACLGNNLPRGEGLSITALPLYHIFSLTVCCLVMVKMGATQVLVINPKDFSALIKTLIKYPITFFTGLTTLFNGLLNQSQFKRVNFSSLKLTIAGGMAVTPAVAERWQQATGSVILEGYGLTEASPVVSMNPIDQHAFKSSIGLPLPSTEISIRDDNGNELPVGEAGELCVRGPQVMRGYWNKQEETNQVFYNDGWLRTGDVVVMDEKGYLYLVDRKKDMILVAGYNVYPNEVEAVISSHPMVLEVAVVGEPSKYAGEIVKAFVVKKDEALTKEKLIAYCRDRLTSYKVPKRVEFKSELPKSNVGKILRRVLRES